MQLCIYSIYYFLGIVTNTYSLNDKFWPGGVQMLLFHTKSMIKTLWSEKQAQISY